MSTVYDDIGKTYPQTRAEEPRIAALIHRALGDARSVVNVGAGCGSYEPRDREVATALAAITEIFPAPRVEAVPLPADCVDGVFTAYWARPERYLEAEVRRNISNFALGSAPEVARGLTRLEADLKSGAWDRKYARLRTSTELDLGHRLFVAELEKS